MALRGVLFDLDGTLADTAAAERTSWPALAELIAGHVPGIDVEELRARYYGVFDRHWTDYLEGRIGFADYRRLRLAEALAPWHELDHVLFEAYRQEKRRAVERLRPFADAVPTLRRMRAAGLRVGLLTNGPSELQRRKLAITRLAPELDEIAISEEIGIAKPDAGAFHTAARLLGCSPSETAMVGDSPAYDIAGAVAARLAAAVLVTRGLAPGVDGDAVSVETLSDVPAALGLGSWS